MTDDGAAPIGAREFASMMLSVLGEERPARLAIGVSGGPDSMALAVLTERWAARAGIEMAALTVDHGLRPESAAEAKQVAAWLAALGLRHVVLRWRGPKPKSGIQQAAREARYRLTLTWCRRNRFRHLLLAHHQEDQAETLLMRLAHASGLDGLAGMAPAIRLDGVEVLRPLLGVSKARLLASLRARRQPWIEDPSNRDPAFLRTRAGRALASLAPAGVLPGRLAKSAERLRRARRALEWHGGALLAATATFEEAGFCRLSVAPFAAQPAETGLRALSRALLAVAGATQPPPLERLEALYDTLLSTDRARRTLHGCRIARHDDEILIFRELRGRPPPVPVPGSGVVLWDGRFQVRLARRRRRRSPPGIAIDALGHWLGASPEILKAGAAPPRVPVPARAMLPAIVDRKGPVAVPHFGFLRNDAGGWLSSASAAFRPLALADLGEPPPAAVVTNE